MLSWLVGTTERTDLVPSYLYCSVKHTLKCNKIVLFKEILMWINHQSKYYLVIY